MQIHRPPADRPQSPEPMRADEIRRMLEEVHRERGGTPAQQHGLRRFVIRFAIIFSLYVLSIGPLYWKWFGAKCGLASPVYLAIYRPLENLAELFPPLGWFLNWYVSLWIF